jgi:hypothetical protein
MKIYWPANTVPNGVESISVIDWPINTFPKCIRVLCGRLNNNNILRIKKIFSFYKYSHDCTCVLSSPRARRPPATASSSCARADEDDVRCMRRGHHKLGGCDALLGSTGFSHGNYAGFFLPTGRVKPPASGSGLPVRFTGNRSNLNLNSNSPLVRLAAGLPGGL